MFEGILIVIGAMFLCAVIFSPFVLWDLYKKKKSKRAEVSKEKKGSKTIIWWQALLCGLVLLSFFVYMMIKNELATTLPAILAYPYYGLCIWCLVFVSRKKIVFKRDR